MRVLFATVFLLSALISFSVKAAEKPWPRGFWPRMERIVKNQCNQKLQFRQTAFCEGAARCSVRLGSRRFPTLSSANRAGMRRYRAEMYNIGVTCGKQNSYLLTGRNT